MLEGDKEPYGGEPELGVLTNKKKKNILPSSSFKRGRSNSTPFCKSTLSKESVLRGLADSMDGTRKLQDKLEHLFAPESNEVLKG